MIILSQRAGRAITHQRSTIKTILTLILLLCIISAAWFYNDICVEHNKNLEMHRKSIRLAEYSLHVNYCCRDEEQHGCPRWEKCQEWREAAQMPYLRQANLEIAAALLDRAMPWSLVAKVGAVMWGPFLVVTGCVLVWYLGRG